VLDETHNLEKNKGNSTGKENRERDAGHSKKAVIV